MSIRITFRLQIQKYIDILEMMEYTGGGSMYIGIFMKP